MLGWGVLKHGVLGKVLHWQSPDDTFLLPSPP